MKLKDAADYIRTSKAPKFLFSLLSSFRRIFSFTQERGNRLIRYIVITRAYKSGQPVKKIAERFGCDKSTVLRYARLAELPKRPKHLPEDIRAAVVADYKRKLPVEKIATLHGVSKAYVSKLAREEGISRYRKLG